MRAPIFSRIADQSTPEATHATDFDRAADALAREHEALANMQGSESKRVDRLVDDVGTIKGFVLAVFLSGAPTLAGIVVLAGMLLLVIAWWP